MSLYEADERTPVRVLGIQSGWGARQNLRAMGIYVGDTIQILRRAPFGGPLAIRTRGIMVAIGRDLAHRVRVEPQE